MVPRKWEMLRNSVLFFGGLSLVVHETVFTAAEHPTLLILAAAMMGLPAMMRDAQVQHTVRSSISQIQARIDAKTRVIVAADELVTDWDAFAEEIEPDLRKLIESGG